MNKARPIVYLTQATIAILRLALCDGTAPGPSFDEQRLFWLTNPNPFPPMPGWIRYEDPFEPKSGFNCRIMVLGMRGHGKSVLGNWMLGNSPIAWPYSPEGTYFETRPGPRNISGFLGRSKLDLTPLRVVELPGLGPGEVYSRTKRQEISEFLDTRDEFYHAFIWVKNASQPRYTRADETTFRLIEEFYGPGWMNNMLIVLAGFNFSDAVTSQLPRWDGFEQRKRLLLESMFKESEHRNMPAIPISGFNPLCDIFEYDQYSASLLEKNAMQRAIELYMKSPVLRKDIFRRVIARYRDERAQLERKCRDMEEEKKSSIELHKLKRRLMFRKDTITRLMRSAEAPTWRSKMVDMPDSPNDRFV